MEVKIKAEVGKITVLKIMRGHVLVRIEDADGQERQSLLIEGDQVRFVANTELRHGA